VFYFKIYIKFRIYITILKFNVRVSQYAYWLMFSVKGESYVLEEFLMFNF